jgi:hypothetical protein
MIWEKQERRPQMKSMNDEKLTPEQEEEFGNCKGDD